MNHSLPRGCDLDDFEKIMFSYAILDRNIAFSVSRLYKSASAISLAAGLLTEVHTDLLNSHKLPRI
jgi:hypothetical protein